MTVILRIIFENPENPIEKFIENKNLLIKLKSRIRRIGYRKFLTNIEWNILNLTCRVIRDKIRSLLLKNKIKNILEKVISNVLTRRERKILNYINNLKNIYKNLIEKVEGAIKNIYNKIINDWEYLYQKAINLVSGEDIGAYIKY